MPPPNTPEEGLVPPTTTTLALRPLTRANAEDHPQPGMPSATSAPDTATTTPAPSMTPTSAATAAVDMRALDYESPTDENLICPICRVPLLQPVITTCDHVFCQSCLVQAHALNPVCPVDRTPLDLGSGTRPAPKMVQNQLDNLRVRCPNNNGGGARGGGGCALVVARALVENHVGRYCERTLVRCPHPGCEKSVVRRDVGKGCLHFEVACEYCRGTMLKADLDAHQERECPNRTKDCGLCGAEFLRSREEEHNKECPEVETKCKFAPFGCSVQMPRKRVDKHARDCDYRVVGPVGEQLAELRQELSALHEKDRLKDRRIKFLENKGFSLPTATASESIHDVNLPDSSANAETAPYESRDQYFLSLFETMESKVERLSSALTEVEGRHSMMLFNETLQIKDQLTEIRSTLGVLGMHVRWLMNFRLQERGRVGTGSPALPGSFNGNNQDLNNSPDLPRRLSDTLREHPPRL